MFFLTILKEYLLLGFLLSQALFYSQNLVLNPSFEKFNKCPSVLGNFNKDVSFWSTPTQGSTDYFNTCSELMGSPKNFKGSQNSNFGKGYAGLFLYAPEDYREYIQVKLTAPLKEGVLYNLSFYVSLADKSDTAIKEFGILFTQSAFEVPIKKVLSRMHLSKLNLGSKTHLEIGYSNFYKDTRDWIVVHTQFTAKGKEQYLTLGNFKNNKRTRRFSIKKEKEQGAYYYIDMIAVSEILSDLKLKETVQRAKVEYTLGEVHVFNNIDFNFDRYEMDSVAKKELYRISEYLKANKEFKISISGHTDTVGGIDYNMRLSTKRAKVVAEYLQSLGISLKRIQWKGYGSSIPLKSKAINNNNAKNRRVEFVISKE